MNIHPTAIVSEKAQIGKNSVIGPFTIIEEDVVVGDNTHIQAHVFIGNGTTIGNNCKVFHGAVIGHNPQDIKFDTSIKTKTVIGNNTTIREYTTIHRGTNATGLTSVGDNCLIMAYCHIAHDCRLGNNIIMANSTQLAGHVTVNDWAIFGGAVLIHQFVSIGCHTMLQGGSKLPKDAPPYTVIGRDPARVEGLNKIGLKRRGFTNETIKEIEKFYKTLLYSGLNISAGIKKYTEEHSEPIEDIRHCIGFITNSQRGILH
jgi:UDP-N-acetylglucosamine acyltransferase